MRGELRLRFLVVLAPFLGGGVLAACSWDVGKIFDRNDPQVEQARGALEASISGGDADLQTARSDLEEVLRYRCEADGGKDLVVDRANASLDLGLVVFRLSELIGRRFGEEELGADSGEEAESVAAARTKELDCAHLLLRRIANDESTPLDLKLRAHYLLGNFEFLSRHYQDAVVEYDKTLIMHPGRGIDPQGEVGAPQDDDAVARDAAWNRAIALKRIHDNEDAGSDADADADADGGDGDADADADGSDGSDSDGSDGSDASDAKDSGSDGESGPDSGAPESGGDTGNQGQDAGSDGKKDDQGDTSPSEGGAEAGADSQVPMSPSSQPPPPPGTNTPPPVPSGGVDLRELDRFDKKAPLDLDLPAKMKERKKLPKGMDK